MSNLFRTRFNYKLYFLVLLVIPFLLALFAGFITIRENIESGNYLDDFGLTIIAPVLIIALICYSFNFYISKSPQIEIDAKRIRIGNEIIEFSEIDKIKVRSKHKTYFLFVPYSYAEASSVSLKNGKEYTLYVEHYLNGSLLRTNLYNLSNFLKGQTSSFKVVSASDYIQEEPQQFYLEDFKEYRQPPYKFFNYYIYTPLILFLIYVAIDFDSLIISSIFLVLALVFYFVLVRQSNYFLLTENLLVIKNYLFPWWKKSLLIKSIYHITTEQQPKQELALKIITKDFGIYRYQSGLMSDSMFRELIESVNISKKKKIDNAVLFS